MPKLDWSFFVGASFPSTVEVILPSMFPHPMAELMYPVDSYKTPSTITVGIRSQFRSSMVLFPASVAVSAVSAVVISAVFVSAVVTAVVVSVFTASVFFPQPPSKTRLQIASKGIIHFFIPVLLLYHDELITDLIDTISYFI